MSEPLQLGGSLQSSHRPAALTALGLFLATGAVAAAFLPAYRALVVYGLYVVPAHLLISVLAHEPMLFETAKYYPAGTVAAVGTAGCVVSALLDYALIGWLVNHRLVRTELDDSRAFRAALRWFGKAPFVLITASAFFPLPFYPAKILAIARGYPAWRFVTAVVIGRLPRFWLLALGGQKIQAPRSALLSAGVALGLIAGWGVWRTVQRNRARTRTQA
jgi:membrane protein YqaA with SNARE-associated domain